ncbi:MAG: GDSL-type esterase/lipase family protein [Opitutales bacterium]
MRQAPPRGETRIPSPDPERFAKAIASFQKEDLAKDRVDTLTLFTGSSSIRMWKSLAKDFPDRETLNRGFGGSHLSDVLHYFDVLVTRHKPAVIVLYCGENDLWAGKPPGQVCEDFETFAHRVHEKLPKTRIHYLACKPSPKRLEKWALYQQCNRMIAKHCAKEERLNFVDVSKVMLDQEGRPLPDIWLADKLHMNAKGYRHWTQLLRPILAKQK